MSQPPLPKYCDIMARSYLKCICSVRKYEDDSEYNKSMCLLKYINSVKYVKQCDMIVPKNRDMIVPKNQDMILWYSSSTLW